MSGIDQYQSSGGTVFSILQWQWHRHGSEVLENTLLILRGRAIRVPPPDIGEGIAQPLRIRRVFSNTSSPCLCHCPIVIGRKINYSVPDD